MNNINKTVVFEHKDFQKHFNDTIVLKLNQLLQDNPSREKVNAFFIREIVPLIKIYALDISDMKTLGEYKGRILAIEPQGIPNRNHSSCGMIAALGMLVAIESAKEKIKNTLLEKYYNDYVTAQYNKTGLVDLDIDSLYKELGFKPNTQVDAAEALTKMLSQLGLEGCLKDLGMEEMSNLENSLQDAVLNQSQENLFIHVSRNNYPRTNKEGVKVPQTLHLKDSSDYKITGCIIHEGEDNKGHYIRMEKIRNQWYLINDSVVKPLTPAEAEENLKKGSIFHYKNLAPITPAPAQAKATPETTAPAPVQQSPQIPNSKKFFNPVDSQHYWPFAAMLEMAVNAESVKVAAEEAQLIEFREFLDLYSQPLAKDYDHRLRTLLGLPFHGPVELVEALNNFLDRIGFTYSVKGTKVVKPLIRLNLKGKVTNLQSAFFETMIEFETTPEDLFLHVNSENLRSAIVVPQTLTLPTYTGYVEIAGCISKTDSEGRFTSIKKVEGKWYSVDGEITEEAANKLLKKGSIFHYRKMTKEALVLDKDSTAKKTSPKTNWIEDMITMIFQSISQLFFGHPKKTG